VANMAKWQRLTPHTDVSLVADFAERFPGAGGPDDVFTDISFGTIMAFAVESKERGEYRERYNYIWGELNRGTHDNTGSNNRGK